MSRLSDGSVTAQSECSVNRAVEPPPPPVKSSLTRDWDPFGDIPKPQPNPENQNF